MNLALCQQLDGLPLAIELAAAWMRVLTPDALLARLVTVPALHLLTNGSHDLPERHQSMDAALLWSYELLNEHEQTLFRLMSVFTGTCTLTAVEAICTSTEKYDLLFDLASLVDKSLVQRAQQIHNEPGYYLLETIRTFGLERLHAAGEQQQLQRHANYYLDLVTCAQSELSGPHQQEWLDRLEYEYANIRAALHWFDEQQLFEQGLQLAGACWRFWYGHGYLREGRQWLEHLLEKGQTASAAARAPALFGVGMLATEQGDYHHADIIAAECANVYQSLDDWRGMASAFNIRGNVAKYQGDFARATRYHEESLRLRRRIDDRAGIGVALNNLGTIAMEQGDYDRATQLHEQSLAIKRLLGDKRGQAVALVNMGDIARDCRQFSRAITLTEEALALFTELHDTRGQALALNNLGEAICRSGDYARSYALLTQSLRLFRQLGDKWGCAVALKNLGDATRLGNDLPQSLNYYHENMDLYHNENNQLGIVEALEAIGSIACQQGKYRESLYIFSAAMHLRQMIGTILPPAESDVLHEISQHYRLLLILLYIV